MTAEEILKNCQLIQRAIDLEIPLGDIDATEGKMLELVSLMGLSAELLKWSKKIILERQGFVIEVIRKQEPGLNATTLKLLLESRMAEELTMYEYAERLNRALVHACDSLRTSISKWKAEKQISEYQK